MSKKTEVELFNLRETARRKLPRSVGLVHLNVCPKPNTNAQQVEAKTTSSFQTRVYGDDEGRNSL